MAEFIMKDIVKKAGREADFTIASAATSAEELGNPVYPPARRKLLEHGISCDGKTARRLTARDYEEYDMLVGMDRYNIKNMLRICSGDPNGKISLLLDYTGTGGEVSDPWYTGDFERAWIDIERGCIALFERLRGADIKI